MKQQVSLPGIAVPSHTPTVPAQEHEAGLATGTTHTLLAESASIPEPAELLPAELSAKLPTEVAPETATEQPATAEESTIAADAAPDVADANEATEEPPAKTEETPLFHENESPESAPEPASAPAFEPVVSEDAPDSASALAAEASPYLHGAPATEAPDSTPASNAPQPQTPSTMAGPAAGGMSEQDDWPPMSEMLQSFFVFEPTIATPEPITVMGIDCARPRGLAGLAEAQRQLAEQADVICAGRLLLEEFSGLSLAGSETTGGESPATTPTIEGTTLKARLLPLSTPLEPLLTRLSQLRAAGERVLVLADGDPLLFGIGATLVRRLGSTAVRLLPAVSSLQQACARLSLPWHKVICLSLHGRDDLRPLNVACGKNAPLCILTDARMSPDVLARHLLDRGVDWFDAHIFERMGAADETVSHLSLADAASREFGPACTMVLVPAAPARRPHLGLDADQLAVDRGLITKKPVRAAALSLLRIEAGHVVWDLGSGSGAVALEASVLAHEGRVIAVERSAGRAMGIQENRRRFGAANVEVRLGQAPECLPGLPDPQRVFIGGGLSGDDGDDILGHVCLRLPVGGRVVVSCVLLDSFSLCRRFFEDMAWPVEILQISAAEGKTLGGDVHLSAMNPVFLLAAQKPAPSPIQSGAQPESR
ncbi:MAG: precorrin-6y C5,15-methyltransferase (decarboxylating) subunit CbiE [Desulfovibrio sp.]|uniref:precorrin-6y C5,15-methyltransferase (decarboxylating) subunit CbiE n=1 Tax=Desulfovibrio sp. TaxID=885 RepID=UPI00135DECC9|nr:precorrin-6y C5,15-methyltransferase (decarboxylating) subunit CbiE [Desulfovibrio sp.]MTJ94266.1 precorrin-6y C5,15-methyltransferase (decarboxylating) subunit CbiE [Desulfovibrio sp.]